MAQLNFDATQVAPDSGTQDALPAGWYNAMIDQSEMKPTKAGDGAYLELRFNVMDGQFANRKFFDRLNIRNPSQQAQDIAYGQLSAICHATGVLNLQDSSQLHGIPLKVKLKVRPATDDYDASNDTTSYKNINENVGAMAAAAPGTTAPQTNQQPQMNQAPQMPQQPAQQPQQQAPVQQQPQQQPPQQQAPQQWQQPQQGGAQQPWQQGNQQQAPQQPLQQEQAPQQQQPVQQAPVQQQPQQPQQQDQSGSWAQTAAQAPGAQPPPWTQPAQ